MTLRCNRCFRRWSAPEPETCPECGNIMVTPQEEPEPIPAPEPLAKPEPASKIIGARPRKR